jgi:hypothetical protein
MAGFFLVYSQNDFGNAKITHQTPKLELPSRLWMGRCQLPVFARETATREVASDDRKPDCRRNPKSEAESKLARLASQFPA